MPRLDDEESSPRADELDAFRALRRVALAIFDAFCPTGIPNDADLSAISTETAKTLNAAYRTLKKAVEYYSGPSEQLSLYDPLPGRPFRKKAL